jgi:hypothetical protein
MPNPMMRKNPFLSLWLSGANAAAGAARGIWLAELHRQQIAMLSEMTRQTIRFWSGAWMLPPPQGKPAKGRR